MNTVSNVFFFHGHVLVYGGVCEAILEGLFDATVKIPTQLTKWLPLLFMSQQVVFVFLLILFDP